MPTSSADVLQLAEQQVLLRDLDHPPEDHDPDEPLPGLVEVGHASPPAPLQHAADAAGNGVRC